MDGGGEGEVSDACISARKGGAMRDAHTEEYLFASVYSLYLVFIPAAVVIRSL